MYYRRFIKLSFKLKGKIIKRRIIPIETLVLVIIMAKKNEKENVMVWSDKEGTYKLGYSQYLMMQQNKLNKFILIALVILIVLVIVAMAISFIYVNRLDQMDAISKMISKTVCLLI